MDCFLVIICHKELAEQDMGRLQDAITDIYRQHKLNVLVLPKSSFQNLYGPTLCRLPQYFSALKIDDADDEYEDLE